MNHDGHLFRNLILFGRLLRRAGIRISPGRMVEVVEALQHVPVGNRTDFYHTLRSMLVHRQEELALFDRAFELFWQRPDEGLIELDLPALVQRPQKDEPIVTHPSPDALEGAEGEDTGKNDDEEDETVVELIQTYSAGELLRQKDFGELTAEELIEIRQMMAALVWRLGWRRSRRRRSGRGRQPDLRRTIRRNLRYGGELLEWGRLRPKVKPRPLVILADISGSMDRYARLLIHFLYSLALGLEQAVEVFVFGTRLTRISRQLHRRDVEQALREVENAVPDWSGGTRIGEALKTFNYAWARRVLNSSAVVLIISDGWDRGDPELLRREMARLQRSCYRLIWLNPLLGSASYEPLTRGIQAALPYVDDFLPVHNLASLEDLAEHLLSLEERRPVRRQAIAPSGAAYIGR